MQTHCTLQPLEVYSKHSSAALIKSWGVHLPHMLLPNLILT